MEPARDEDQRTATSSELDSILREVEATRRKVQHAEVAPTPVPEPVPPIGVVPPAPAALLPPPQAPRPGVRFENPIKIEKAGELQIRAFKLPAHSAAMALLGIVALCLWSVAPGGFDAMRPKPLPQSYRDASLRWMLVLTAERVDRFREEHARLPATLEELGPGAPEIVYQPVSEFAYVLKAADETRVLELRPNTARKNFLAGSLDVLRQGPNQAP